MRLIFMNRYFHPDHSATSQILSDVSFGLADRGYRVHVVTSRQRYDAPHKRLRPRESVRGVEVHRVWTTRFGRVGLIGRAVDYVTFYLSAGWRLWRLARAGDVVIAKTDPPMLSVIAAPIARARGASLVNWLQDIFPEVAQALRVGRGAFARGAYGLMRRVRDRSLQSSTRNVVLGERMARHLVSLGLPRERICVIPNFADGALLAPAQAPGEALRRAWGLSDRFVVGYSGNLGRAHEIDTLIEAMTRLAAEKKRAVSWLLVGGGVLFEALKGEVARRRLKDVRFKPYQPRARLAASLSAADVHIVSLRPELEGLIVPSKIYGVAAVGRPTIFVGDPDGEIAELLARHDCGRTVRAGDGAALARAILELAADVRKRRAMGKRARRAFEREFEAAIAVARWEQLIDGIAGAYGPGQAEEAPRLEVSARNAS